MKSYWLMVSGLCLAGCLANNGLQYEAVSETNQYHLARVRKGMSERQVLFIMHKPYSYESFQVADDIYDVWFYVTRVTSLGQTRMVPQNLTPLTFKNGILVGTGYPWYYYAMKEQANEVAAQNPPPPRPKTQEEEDAEFEKALRTYKPQTNLSQTPTSPTQPPPQQPTQPAQKQPTQPSAIQPPSPQQPTQPPAMQPAAPTQPHPPSGAILHANGPLICPDRKLSHIARGMTETQVFSLMGEPENYSSYEIGGDVYDVWFYETFPSKTGKRSIVPQNVTPLTFKNAFLVGLTEEEYFDLKAMVDHFNTPEPTPAVKEAPLSVEEAQPAAEITTATEPAPQVPASTATFIKPWTPPPVGMVQKNKLKKISPGMTETEVTNLLGLPSHTETFQMGDDLYDVWFYEIYRNKQNYPIEEVPLTFKNTVLVGMTLEYYNSIQNATDQDQVDGYDRNAERMQEQESEQNFNYW